MTEHREPSGEFECNQLCAWLCRENKANCLQAMYDSGTLKFENWIFKSYALLFSCAIGDSVDCLKFLIEHGFPLSAPIMTDFVNRDAVKCLQFAHEHGQKLSDEWHAATYGHLECLKYIHSHHDSPCECEGHLYDFLVRKQVAVFKYLASTGMKYDEDACSMLLQCYEDTAKIAQERLALNAARLKSRLEQQ